MVGSKKLIVSNMFATLEALFKRSIDSTVLVSKVAAFSFSISVLAVPDSDLLQLSAFNLGEIEEFESLYELDVESLEEFSAEALSEVPGSSMTSSFISMGSLMSIEDGMLFSSVSTFVSILTGLDESLVY